MLLRLFFTVLTVSLKPLTRAHRTIQHFSKNTPGTRLKCPHAVLRTRHQAHTFPDDSSSVLVSGWSPTAPLKNVARRLALPQSRRLMTSLQNRTALSNIASIFCLSMLFSKNSRSFLPDPFEKNTSQHPKHCPISQGSLSMITPHSLNSASPNQAGDI